MIYVIVFYKVEQTCPIVYPVMIWLYNMWVGQGKREDRSGFIDKLFHNLSQSPFLRYRLYNWLLDEEGGYAE